MVIRVDNDLSKMDALLCRGRDSQLHDNSEVYLNYRVNNTEFHFSAAAVALDFRECHLLYADSWQEYTAIYCDHITSK
jgi:hypothetical protein